MGERTRSCEQHVLVLPSSTLSSYYAVEGFHEDPATIKAIEDLIANAGYFVPRHAAEHDSSVIQIIAYGILRHGDKLLCIRRSQNSNRPTLRLKYTVLFGGHVDDVESSTPVESSINREFQEELGVYNKVPHPRLLGIVTDPTNDVGRRHLGLVFDILHSDESVDITPVQDTMEFVGAGHSSHHEFMGWKELLKYADNLDAWSRLFLSSKCAVRLLNAPRPIILSIPLALNWQLGNH